MAAVGTLTIEMAANVARLQRDMERATKTVGGAMDRIQRSVQGATRALGLLTAAFATVKSIQGIIQQADAMTLLNSRLRLVTTSQEEFIKIQGSLLSISQRTFTSIGATVDLYTALARSTKDVGVSQNELLRVVETFNKAIIISGGSVQAAEAAITQFNQAMASGVLRGEEFNSISEQAPMIMEILANQLGVTRGALRDMAKEGLLVADLVLPALIDGSKGVDEQFNNMSMTVGQATNQLSQSIALLINQIDQSTGFSKTLAESISSLGSTIRGLSGIVEDNKYALMAWAGVFLAPAVVTGITTLIASLAALRVAILGITAALAANPIGLALLALTAAAVPAINAMNDYFVAQDKAKESQDGFNETAAETNRLLRQNEESAKANNEAVMSTARARLEQAKADKIALDAAKKLKDSYDDLVRTLNQSLRASTAALQAEQQGLNTAQEEFLELVSGPEWKQYSAAQKMIITDLYKQRIETEQLIDLEKERAKAAEDRLKKMLDDEKEFREELKREDDKRAEEKLKKEQEFYEAQRREIEKIGDQLTDALMRAFESGKGFGQAFKDTLINMFRTMVLRPVLAPISGAFAGAFGGSAAAAGPAGMTGTTGFLGGLAVASASIGTGIAAGFTNALSLNFAGSLQAAGSLIGTGALSGITAGVGMIAGTLLPIVGAVSLIKSLTGGDGKDPTGMGAFVTTRGVNINRELVAATTGFKISSNVVGDFFDRANEQLKPAVQTIVDGILDRTQDRARAIGLEIALGIDAGLVADPAAKSSFGYASVFLGDQEVENFVNRKLGPDFEQATIKFTEQLQESIAKAVLDAGNIVIPAGQTATATLERLGSSILAVNSTFDTLGLTMFQTSIAGAEMAANLIDLLGGVESFTMLSAQYYQEFYTEAERVEILTRQLTSQFGELGLELPATREAFRNLVEAQDLTTESGRQMFAALMQLNPAFASISPSLDLIVEAVDDLGESVLVSEAILQERISLEDRLLRLQGDTDALRERERNSLDESNRALFDRITLLEDEQEAQAELRRQQQEAQAELERQQQEAQALALNIANERISLETRLLQLQGDTDALRERERNSLDESNRALFDRITLLQDEQEAQAELARQQQEAQAQLERQQQEAQALAERIAGERISLETRLLQLQGDTEALRDREREALDESNRALLDRIFALEDEIQATEDATRAAQQYADELQSQFQEAQNVTNQALEAVRRSIQSEIERYQQAAGATDSAFARLQRSVEASARKAEESITKTYNALNDALSLQLQSAATAKSVAQENVSALQSVFDLLKSNIEDLMTDILPQMTVAQGRVFLARALATAQSTGYLPDREQLSSAISAVRSGLTPEAFGSSFEMRREQLRLVVQLQSLQNLTGNQLSTAELQLKAADEQVLLLERRIEDARLQFELDLQQNRDYYDSILQSAQDQIDATRGVDTSIISVNEAINLLQTAIEAEEYATSQIELLEQQLNTAEQQVNALRGIDNSIISLGSAISSLSSAVRAEARASTAAALAVERARIASAATTREFAAGGLHNGGMRLVGERGPELEITGPARYMSNANLSSMMNNGNNEEIKQMREENKVQMRAMVSLQNRMTKIIEQWNGDGLPTERVEA